MCEVAKERSDVEEDDKLLATKRAKVLKAATRFVLASSNVVQGELDRSIKLFVLAGNLEKYSTHVVGQNSDHLPKFRVPVAARQWKLRIMDPQVENGIIDNGKPKFICRLDALVKIDL